MCTSVVFLFFVFVFGHADRLLVDWWMDQWADLVGWLVGWLGFGRSACFLLLTVICFSPDTHMHHVHAHHNNNINHSAGFKQKSLAQWVFEAVRELETTIDPLPPMRDQ
jgi:hypothetical protein